MQIAKNLNELNQNKNRKFFGAWRRLAFFAKTEKQPGQGNRQGGGDQGGVQRGVVRGADRTGDASGRAGGRGRAFGGDAPIRELRNRGHDERPSAGTGVYGSRPRRQG